MEIWYSYQTCPIKFIRKKNFICRNGVERAAFLWIFQNNCSHASLFSFKKHVNFLSIKFLCKLYQLIYYPYLWSFQIEKTITVLIFLLNIFFFIFNCSYILIDLLIREHKNSWKHFIPYMITYNCMLWRNVIKNISRKWKVEKTMRSFLVNPTGREMKPFS